MAEEHAETLTAEDAFGALVAAVKRPRGDSGGNGDGGGGGGDNGGGGDDPDWFEKLLRSAFQRIGEQQGEFLHQATETFTSHAHKLADLVVETADKSELMAGRMGDAFSKSLEQTTYLAGRLADFMERTVALEAKVAQLEARLKGPPEDQGTLQ
jgi:hypothetical protein